MRGRAHPHSPTLLGSLCPAGASLLGGLPRSLATSAAIVLVGNERVATAAASAAAHINSQQAAGCTRSLTSTAEQSPQETLNTPSLVLQGHSTPLWLHQ